MAAESGPRHGTALAEARIRTLLAELGEDVRNLGSELVHSDAFRSEEWPRGVYALDRTDVEALLGLLDQARTLRITPRSLEALITTEVHSPARVRAYLAANGWTLADQREKASKWVNATVTRPGWAEPGSAVTVLDWTGFSDYAHYLALTVADLATLHGVGELQVLKDIAEADDV